MVKDVRSRLKSIAAKGGKYFTGTEIGRAHV